MGVTPRQIEDVLRIKEEYVLALENGHYAQLPTVAIARGFLRTYAQFLGLTPQLPTLLERFSEETQGLSTAPKLVMPVALPEAKTPSIRLVLGGVVAAIALAIFYSAGSGAPELPVKTPLETTLPAPVVEGTVDKVADAKSSTAQPSAAAPAIPPVTPVTEAPAAVAATTATDVASNNASMAGRVQMRATDDVWVQIQDKMGATIFSRLLRKGESLPVPAGEGLTLNTGNGAGLVLELDGASSKPLGTRAEVVRGIPLDVAKVRTRLQQDAKKPAPKPPAASTTPATPAAPLAIIAPPSAADAITPNAVTPEPATDAQPAPQPAASTVDDEE